MCVGRTLLSAAFDLIKNLAELRSAWTGEGARPHTVLADHSRADYCWPSFSKNRQIDSIPR